MHPHTAIYVYRKRKSYPNTLSKLIRGAQSKIRVVRAEEMKWKNVAMDTLAILSLWLGLYMYSHVDQKIGFQKK